MNYYLGVDTSNYTTSVAALCADQTALSFRAVLSAPPGAVGLRQSDAHFLHTKNLPRLSAQLKEALPADARLCGVGVSTRPRPVEGSYMPCFLAGEAAASLCAAAAGVPLVCTTHQEGHIAAALYGAQSDILKDAPHFFALHLSGGTMELLEVQTQKGGYRISRRAATKDLTAGQLIDRCGVMLSLAFPCGRKLDALALKSARVYSPRVQVCADGVNLSGFENQAQGLFAGGAAKEDVAAFVLSAVCAGVEGLIKLRASALPVLFCGGVSASAFLRKHFADRDDFVFTTPSYATDNAVGTALLCAQKET